jgi:hypothetical protein
MIVHDKTGGRTVHLLIPFEVMGKKIESITFAPVRFGHTMRWGDGDWKTSLALLVELAGVEEAVIRELRYPDADRVMEVFLGMLPADIREDVTNGRVPTKQEPPPPPEAPVFHGDAPSQPATNGSAMPQQPLQGPGVPIPQFDTQPGFDLSDEQP